MNFLNRIQYLGNFFCCFCRKYVRLGEWNFKTVIDCENYVCADKTEDIPIAKTISKYDPNWEWTDSLALIKLKWAATYTSIQCPFFFLVKYKTVKFKTLSFQGYVAPICLPNSNRESYYGSSFVVSGWADTKTCNFFCKLIL